MNEDIFYESQRSTQPASAFSNYTKKVFIKNELFVCYDVMVDSGAVYGRGGCKL